MRYIVICFLCFLPFNIVVYAIDKVDVIAPSSKGKESDLIIIKKYLETLGMNVYISEKIYSDNNPFYSNSDELRASDLINALIDDSKIIWCIKGGKGASRLIPHLEKLPKKQKEQIAKNRNKKIFIGYSDITALHIYLQKHYDWQTIHGTMLTMIVNNVVSQSSISNLKKLIFAQKNYIRFDNLKIISNKAKFKNSKLESKIIGGNMTIVENSVGTNWQINAKDKILFLEDIHVQPYSIERSLDHLKQANIFDGVHAVIFGDFIHSGDENLVQVIKKRFAESVDFPVFTMNGIGHGYINEPLPLNTKTTINIKNEKEGLFFMKVQNIDSLRFS